MPAVCTPFAVTPAPGDAASTIVKGFGGPFRLVSQLASVAGVMAVARVR